MQRRQVALLKVEPVPQNHRRPGLQLTTSSRASPTLNARIFFLTQELKANNDPLCQTHLSCSSALTSLKGCNGSTMVPLVDCSNKQKQKKQRPPSNGPRARRKAYKQYFKNNKEAARVQQSCFVCLICGQNQPPDTKDK